MYIHDQRQRAIDTFGLCGCFCHFCRQAKDPNVLSLVQAIASQDLAANAYKPGISLNDKRIQRVSCVANLLLPRATFAITYRQCGTCYAHP